MHLKVNAILLFCISLFPVTRGIVFDLERLSIDQILKTVSENVSCVEITQYFLYRIRKYNPKINAIITVDERGALDQAERLDSYYKKHKSFIGKLHCAPALVKDNILVKGMPMTLGIGYFVNATSANDAPAVQRMKEAGAVILGKANLTPLAMSAPETPSVGGRVWNPHSMGDSASSSSNGNAAALAARLCVIGLASDSSGSTTCPATVTHVVGLRPPVQSFDMSGLFPIRGPTHDTMGLMALAVKDLCALIDIVSETSADWCDNDTLADQPPPIRVGIIGNLTYGSITIEAANSESTFAIDPEILPAFRRFEANLRQLNNVSVEVSWDDHLVEPYNNVTDQDWASTCDCMGLWMDHFLKENEMIASPSGQRIRDVKSLLRLAFNGFDYPYPLGACDDELLKEWYCVLFGCSFTNWEACNYTRTVSQILLQQAHAVLESTLLEKYDVLVFTQNSHQLLSYLDSYGRSLGDLGSVFAYPSLVIPIGFSTPGWLRWNSVPVSAYFITTPRKFHLMMNLAKRYETRFWEPKMPANFD